MSQVTVLCMSGFVMMGANGLPGETYIWEASCIIMWCSWNMLWHITVWKNGWKNGLWMGLFIRKEALRSTLEEYKWTTSWYNAIPRGHLPVMDLWGISFNMLDVRWQVIHDLANQVNKYTYIVLLSFVKWLNLPKIKTSQPWFCRQPEDTVILQRKSLLFFLNTTGFTWKAAPDIK